MVAASAEVAAFLAELKEAEAESWWRIPGLGGPYRAKHVRKGLATGAIVMHWSGKGFCWGCVEGTDSRGRTALMLVRTVHALEVEIAADDTRGRRMDKKDTQKLLAAFRRLDFGLDKPPARSLSFEL